MNESDDSSDNDNFLPKLLPAVAKRQSLQEPTRPISAYGLFFQDHLDLIRSQNREATFSKLSEIVTRMWNALPGESRQIYVSKATGARDKYLKELAEYRQACEEQPPSTASSNSYDSEDDLPLAMFTKIQLQPERNLKQEQLKPPPKLKQAPNMAEVVKSDRNKMLIKPPINSRPLLTSEVCARPLLQKKALRQLAKVSSMTTTSKTGKIVKTMPTIALVTGKGVVDVVAPRKNSSDQAENIAAVIKPVLPTMSVETKKVRNRCSSLGDDFDDDIAADSLVDPSGPPCKNEMCQKPSVDDQQWNYDYCSTSCVVKHTRKVFEAFIKDGTSFDHFC